MDRQLCERGNLKDYTDKLMAFSLIYLHHNQSYSFPCEFVSFILKSSKLVSYGMLRSSLTLNFQFLEILKEFDQEPLE